jgi:hypothetical protein
MTWQAPAQTVERCETDHGTIIVGATIIDAGFGSIRML